MRVWSSCRARRAVGSSARPRSSEGHSFWMSPAFPLEGAAPSPPPPLRDMLHWGSGVPTLVFGCGMPLSKNT